MQGARALLTLPSGEVGILRLTAADDDFAVAAAVLRKRAVPGKVRFLGDSIVFRSGNSCFESRMR